MKYLNLFKRSAIYFLDSFIQFQNNETSTILIIVKIQISERVIVNMYIFYSRVVINSARF